MVAWQEEREEADGGDEQVEIDGEDMDVDESDSGDSGDSSSYDSEDDSSFDSAIDNEAGRLMSALAPEQQEARHTPQELWKILVNSVAKGGALKVTDSLVEWIADTPNLNERVALTEICVTELLQAVQTAPALQHVILGRVFLSLLSDTQQAQLYQALVARHASTCSFWKLGSDDSTAACGIDTSSLLQAMGTSTWDTLTELELRGVHLWNVGQLDLILQFIQQCPKIRQYNLLGATMSDDLLAMEGFLDSLVRTVQVLPGFDELQVTITRTNNNDDSTPPLVTPTALQTMLTTKPKWWRLAMDGLGLDDRHVKILSTALKASDTCKMNDLLSLQDNPGITADGLQTLYTVCINKQRMGLVLSDDAMWVATMDLVRPLNNLHRRLEYRTTDGQYVNRERWIEWLAVQANLPWIGDARKVNYLWFTLLEQPGLVCPVSE